MPCYLNRTCIILVCASWLVYACVFTMLFVPFRVASHVSFGFVPELWGFVRLWPFVFFLDSFFFLAGFQARWSYPRNHYYLCYASLLALAMPMLRCLPFACQPPKLPCQTSNPPCPSKPLIGYVTALLSPSYSVASCRWSWRLLHGGQGFVGISQYLLYY